ncbi:hypothetical protein HDU81_000735 [Chytriomyces hyalinus]|nr:hypothetical protein HDU81_000735 [Chytriomyces hyalinus]
MLRATLPSSSAIIQEPRLFDGGFDIVQTYINSDPSLKQEMARIGSGMQTINVPETMQKLSKVGSLLQLAYAGTKGLPCSKHTMMMLCSYQTLIKDSHVATNLFVQSSLLAVKQHQLALRILPRGPDRALRIIAKTSEMARQMAEASSNLVASSENMVKLAQDALIQAATDDTTQNAQKAAIEKEISNFNSMQARLKSLTASLAEDVEEARVKEAKAVKDADEARSRAHTTAILGAIMQPLSALAGGVVGGNFGGRSGSSNAPKQSGNNGADATASQLQELKRELNQAQSAVFATEAKLASETDSAKKTELEKELSNQRAKAADLRQTSTTAASNLQRVLESQAESLEAKEAVISNRRAELQREARTANAELAECVERLKGSHAEQNSLETVISSLEVAMKSMGQIKTVFENTRVFWVGVQKSCERLGNAEDNMKELIGVEDIFEEEIRANGMNWLSLGQINYVGMLAMGDVSSKVDSIMNDLPDSTQASGIIQDISTSMLASIKQEQLAMAAEE